MTTIYISDSGDDKNDGRSLQTAIYSLKRVTELHGGRNDCSPTIHASKIANEQNHLRHGSDLGPMRRLRTRLSSSQSSSRPRWRRSSRGRSRLFSHGGGQR